MAQDCDVKSIPLEEMTAEVESQHKTWKGSGTKVFMDWLRETKTHHTLAYFCCFISIALATAALGPALLALGRKTNSDVHEMGYVFSARSVGYLLGSAIGGPLFDKYNGNRLIALATSGTIVALFFIPITSNIVVLALLVSTTGVMMGFLDTGGNVSIIWLHGDKAGPYMQALHFCFGIGAFVAPMIVGSIMTSNNGDPTWGFWIIGLLSVPLPFWLLIYPAISHAHESSGGYTVGTREKFIVALVGLFLCIDVGAEVSAGGYLFSYSVTRNLLSERDGAYLTSAFWGFLTVGRGLAVPISFFLVPAESLSINLIGCFLSIGFILIFINSTTALWIGTVFYGLFISSVFPTAINLAESYMKLTGKIAAVVVVGASLGEMLIPLLVANLFSFVGPTSFLVVLLFCAVGGFCTYITILIVGKGKGKQIKEVKFKHEVSGGLVELEDNTEPAEK